MGNFWTMRLLAASLFFFLAPRTWICHADDVIDWLHTDVSGKNVSSEFQDLWSRADERFDFAAAQGLKSYRFLLVPGIFAKMTPLNRSTRQANSLLRMDSSLLARTGSYFEQQRKWMQSAGLDVTKAAVNTQETSGFNARWIRAWLRASPKDVIIIGHSKGTLDAIEALMEEPELRKKVKAIISLQTPYWGSPIADAITDNSKLNAGAAYVFAFFGGTIECLHDLQEKERIPYMQKNAAVLAELRREITILSFAAWKDPPENWWQIDTVLKIPRDQMFQDPRSMSNDGFVPWKSEIFPGTDYVALGGVDHFATVESTPPLPFDRVRLLKALLMMTLERIGRADRT